MFFKKSFTDQHAYVARRLVSGQFLVRNAGRQGKDAARPAGQRLAVQSDRYLIIEIQDEHVARVGVFRGPGIEARPADRHEQRDLVRNETVHVPELILCDRADQSSYRRKVVLHAQIIT